MRRDLHEQNRLSWNEATRAHNSHKGDQAAFFRNGGSTLFPEELELLGDVAGRSLVHLQCNSGQDSLSLARLGATVTGVDISDVAIEAARKLSNESGIAATFHRADLLDWLEEVANGTDRFDLAFSSYGAMPWISDVRAWARGIASVLRSGGRFALVEFHPAATMLDEELALHFPYMGGTHVGCGEGVGDYVADSGEGLVPGGLQGAGPVFRNPHPSHEFAWGIGDVVTALLDAGLALETLREYPYSNGWKPFRQMVVSAGRRMRLPGTVPELPLMYGIAARKNG